MLGAVRHGLQLVSSAIASALGAKTFAQRVPVHVGTTEFTLGAPAQGVVVDVTMLPGGVGTFAIGGPASTNDGGYEAVVSAGFNVPGTETPSAADYLAIDDAIINAVEIFDDRGEKVETPDGEQVFGLLQAEATVADGDAVAAAAVENAQISFVYRPHATPGLPNMALYDLPDGDYSYGLKLHRRIHNLSYISLIVGADPLPDVATSVYYIPTFSGVSYTSFPVGSLVVATDVGRLREVGPNAWGIRKREYDEPLVADQTIFVRDTGDDDAGDGTTAPTAYATLARALLDIPTYHSGTNIFGYIIDWDSVGGTLDFGAGIEYRGGWPRLVIRGPDLAADAGIFNSGDGTATINAVASDTRAGGRQLTFAAGDIPGGAWAAHEHKGKRIALTSGAESGAVGWVYDNDATSLFVELDTNNFGTLAADDVLITDFPANLVIAGGVAEVLGSVSFINCDIEVQGALNMQQMFVQLAVTRIRLGNAAGSFLNMVDGGSCLGDSVYLWNQASGQRNMMLGTRGAKFIFNSGPSVVDGWGGGAARSINMNTWDMDLHFDQEVVFADVDQVHIGCPTITCGVANDGRFIRMHGCGHLFEQQITVEVGESRVELPAVFGTVTDNYLIALQAPANQGRQHWEFMEAPNFTTALGANVCGIGGAEAYFEHDVEIWGTGNGEKLLYVVDDWAGGPAPAVGPPGGLIGYLLSMDFAAPPAGESIVGHFTVPDEFRQGAELEFDFKYSSSAAALADADFTFNTALYRDDNDADVNPPANLETVANEAIPESLNLQEVTESQRIAMTDPDGLIGGIAPDPGDTLAINVVRNNVVGSVAVFSVYPKFRVWMTGL